LTALITGASSGIGLQYATLLAKEWNADLLLVSNQEKELQETADFLRDSYGVKVDALCIDLTGDDAAETVYSFAAERSLEIDILVNNAGVFFFGK
jgi:short-subunit dehydrogenase